MIETQVLIIGGGPVGLTLAGELGLRGTPCLLVEERTAPTEHPKATLLGARSMEHFRRWGITREIYRNALPPDTNYHITFSTRLTGHELHRVTSPSIRETIERPPEVMAKYRELAWSPYYKTQIGQQALEPVLWSFVAGQAGVDLRHGWRFLESSEDDTGVTSRILEVATGRVEKVRSAYVAACDGGGSGIRRALGIRMNGRGRMRPNVSFFFESEEFLTVHERGLGNLYFIFAPDCFGLFTAIDGVKRWSFQFYFLDPSKRTDDLDAADVLARAMGRPFPFELKGVQHWHHHQSVAKRWRSRVPNDALDGAPGRIFLAGDAAHLFAPTGGVGMNTGIGDAVDLAWKLDAVLSGWGGPRLLGSYEAERRPIAIRNSVISANNSDKIDMVMDETPPEVEEDGPRGDAVRAQVAARIRWMAKQFNSGGTHLGYRYVDSPVVVPDGTPEPPDDFTQVVPSTWPGSRAPHGWTTDAMTAHDPSTLDWFGDGLTLVTAGPPDETAALAGALQARGATVTVQALARPELIALYERRHVLVRPDGHVAWRGDATPPNPKEIADVVLGF